jgi:hydroxymethylpyrimidine pyrophosphatase-like HAD family hydrolase/membrane-associated phospholipid phosphatase
MFVQRRLAALLIAVLASTAIFAALAEEAFEGERLGLDVAIEHFMFRWLPEAHTHGDIFRSLVVFAFIALLILVPALLARQGRLRDAAFWVISFAALDAFGIGRVIAGAEPHEYTFPSAGAMLFGALAAASAPLVADQRRRTTVVAAAVALAVVHGVVVVDLRLSHPSAVVAGWLAAVAWVTVAWIAVGRPHATALPRHAFSKATPGLRLVSRAAVQARDARATRRLPASGLLEPNLFLSFQELSDRLVRLSDAEYEDEHEAALDRFLLAAGLNQILEDDLQRYFLSLWRASTHLPGPLARAARVTARAGCRARELAPGARRLSARQQRLAELTGRLAEIVAGEATTAADLDALARSAVTPVADLPVRLRRSIQRLPNCFRSFDQQPADCRRLVARFARERPDRARPLLVVGLRTSGNYLAPLHAAFLRAAGYQNVRVLTLRPGRLLRRAETKAIAAAARDGATALVVDDPPRTGRQLAEAAGALRERGLTDVVLVLQLPGDEGSVPPVLHEFPLISLAAPDWAIREHLQPAALEATLADLLVGECLELFGERAVNAVSSIVVTSVEELPPRRGHVGARIVALVRVRETARDVTVPIYAEGVGLGYFGRHGDAIAGRLEGHLAPVYGVRDGLLFRAWLPEEARLTPAKLRAAPEQAAAVIARYVDVRSRLLPLPDDVTLRLEGRDAVWQHTAHMLAGAYGRLSQLVRPVTHRAAQRLLAVDAAAVGDAVTRPWEWFGDGTGLRKTSFEQRASTNVGFQSCDPVFDLADAAAAAEADGLPGFEDRIRIRYEQRTGVVVDDERWLLYRLVHHAGAYRAFLAEAAQNDHDDAAFARALQLERTMSRCHARYFENLYFRDLAPAATGPLCALDLDGVVETRWVVFPAIAPAGALALRALTGHGLRPVIVTGRSLEEARMRCSAYHIAGAAAEYGSVVYDHRSGRERSLLSDEDRAALSELRTALEARGDVHVDAAYRHSVRAHTLRADGTRGGLSDATIAATIEVAGLTGRIKAIRGVLQTDFVAAGVDKGRGLTALAKLLGAVEDGRPDIRLAVGDQVSDLPMFALARNAYAPANADPVLRAQVQPAGAPYGAGLLRAVTAVLGHQPRRCPDCRPPEPARESTRILLTALSALDGGRGAKVSRALALSAALARA